MKKYLILLALLLVFLCGCSAKEEIDDDNSFTVASFSYQADRAKYENQPGVKTSGFVNTTKNHITGAEQLKELAENDCTIEYTITTMAYDSQSQVYKFSFSTMEDEEDYCGSMDVYIDKDGVTLMTVTTEPESNAE